MHCDHQSYVNEVRRRLGLVSAAAGVCGENHCHHKHYQWGRAGYGSARCQDEGLSVIGRDVVEDLSRILDAFDDAKCNSFLHAISFPATPPEKLATLPAALFFDIFILNLLANFRVKIFSSSLTRRSIKITRLRILIDRSICAL